MSKICFKCGKKKQLKKFYAHKEMGDGHLNKCIVCTKKDTARRYSSPEGQARIREYERKRWRDPERRKRAYGYMRAHRGRYPGKTRARYRVANAVRDGKLMKAACEVCGETRVQAHHEDYRRPLVVRWLCRKHHLAAEGKIAW